MKLHQSSSLFPLSIPKAGGNYQPSTTSSHPASNDQHEKKPRGKPPSLLANPSQTILLLTPILPPSSINKPSEKAPAQPPSPSPPHRSHPPPAAAQQVSSRPSHSRPSQQCSRHHPHQTQARSSRCGPCAGASSTGCGRARARPRGARRGAATTSTLSGRSFLG